MERMARRMLADDAELRMAFERRLRDDPVFAKDSQARLDFFYQRTPYFDQTYLRYPVLRLDGENLQKVQRAETK